MKFESVLTVLLAGAMSLPAVAQKTQTQDLEDFSVPPNAAPAEPGFRISSAPQPQDALRSYEEQMDLVTVQTYTEMSQISQAVRTHQISSAQAEYFVRRGYELALLRFIFLDTLHDIAQTSGHEGTPPKTEEQKATVDISGDTLVVAPPLFSAPISDTVVKYLELTPGQIAVIQTRVTQQQKEVQPLLRKLSQNREALASASKGSSDHEIRKLAAEQSHILERLIVANSRLQQQIYEVLAPPQRRKLEAIGQTSVDISTKLFAQR